MNEEGHVCHEQKKREGRILKLKARSHQSENGQFCRLRIQVEEQITAIYTAAQQFQNPLDVFRKDRMMQGGH